MGLTGGRWLNGMIVSADRPVSPPQHLDQRRPANSRLAHAHARAQARLQFHQRDRAFPDGLAAIAQRNIFLAAADQRVIRHAFEQSGTWRGKAIEDPAEPAEPTQRCKDGADFSLKIASLIFPSRIAARRPATRPSSIATSEPATPAPSPATKTLAMLVSRWRSCLGPSRRARYRNDARSRSGATTPSRARGRSRGRSCRCRASAPFP